MSSAVKEEMNSTIQDTPKGKPNVDKLQSQGNQNKGGPNQNNKQNPNKKNMNNNKNANQNQNNQNKKFNNQNNNNRNQNFNQQQQQNSSNNNASNNQFHQNKFHNKQNQSNEHLNRQYHEDGGHQNGEYQQQNRPYKIILGQPTLELPSKDVSEAKKFTGRCRIFVANLPNNTTEEALRKLFEEFGEVSEVYLGKSNFAFVKMDTRKNAETAKNSIDGRTLEGRQLRVRLAAHAAALKVKNLSNTVTNELLEYAFSYFGEVERAIVITDDRGRSIGEGIVEFARKFSAQNCLKRCSTECFLITAIPRPVFVEPFEQRDEEEGFPEKQINKNTHEFRQEREIGPRFAEPGTFEHEYSVRWMKLIELEKQKRDNLEVEINEARKSLEEQLEYSRVEHQTKMLREQLREMEQRADKFGQMRTSRMDEDRRKDEERQKQFAMLRQQEEDIIRRSQMQDVSNLRRQENDLRSKASALQNLLDKQEQTIGQVVANPAAPVMVPPNDPQLQFQNRLNFNDPALVVPQQQMNQPIYNTGMPMIANNPMNAGGIDFNNRYAQPVPPANQPQPPPFAGQNPMATMGMSPGMNGPSFGPGGAGQNVGRQNRNFSNNNRNYQQNNNGMQKRIRRY